MVPCKRTTEDVSFEWSHHTISLTDSKVRTTPHVSVKLTVGAEGLKKHSKTYGKCTFTYGIQ